MHCENCKSENTKYIGVHSYDDEPYKRDVYECNDCTCTFSVEHPDEFEENCINCGIIITPETAYFEAECGDKRCKTCHDEF